MSKESYALQNKRNEPLPTTKAAIRLLRLIFSNAMDIPEFQRQVSLQYVVKFTSALVPLADNHPETELKVSINQCATNFSGANLLPGAMYGDIVALDSILCVDTPSICHDNQRLRASVFGWFCVQPHK